MTIDKVVSAVYYYYSKLKLIIPKFKKSASDVWWTSVSVVLRELKRPRALDFETG